MLAGIVLMFLIARMAESGDFKIKLGDDVFVAGNTDRLSKAIAKDGPLLIPDASPSQARDIYVQHLGADPEKGWLAFSAQPNGSSRECSLEWKPRSKDFVDPCTSDRYPSDGKGLIGYKVEVIDSKVVINLRVQESEGATTTPIEK